MELLTVDNLQTTFRTRHGLVRAVDGVSFTMSKGEALGIAGETGSGKSVTARSIMRTLSEPPAKVTADRMELEELNLLTLKGEQLRRMWGNDISMIFQDPSSSLNPLFTVGYQLSDIIRQHEKIDRKSARVRALDMLRLVGMPDPGAVLNRFPFQLSGGMQQRVMIAMSLACSPRLLIADEPTTALDVTIQAQILLLLRELKERAAALMLITHDLAVIAELCDRVAIMYGGKLVEIGLVEKVLHSPLHPYTKGLLAALPGLDASKTELPFIKGNIPSALNPPEGCRFFERCPIVETECRQIEPEMRGSSDHSVCCHVTGGGSDD